MIIQSEPPKDVDTYIHRAGRTARAGREGVCLTLYTKMQEDYLRRITKTAKINFTKVGAPQKDEIIGSNLRDITQSISKIDESVKILFEVPAKVNTFNNIDINRNLWGGRINSKTTSLCFRTY